MTSGEMGPAKSQCTNSNGLVALRSGALLKVWTIYAHLTLKMCITLKMCSVLDVDLELNAIFSTNESDVSPSEIPLES